MFECQFCGGFFVDGTLYKIHAWSCSRKGKPGGMAGKKHSEVTKQKISESLMGHKNSLGWNKGRKFPQAGPKISKALTGRKLSKEHCDNISKSNIIKINQNNGLNPGLKGSVKGRFYSLKNRCDLYYESSWELVAFRILEQLSEVKWYSRCRFSVDYVYEQVIHRYIPDVLVTYTSGRQEVVEVKPNFKLKEDRVKLKINALRKYCKQNNMSCSVWTEKELHIIK